MKVKTQGYIEIFFSITLALAAIFGEARCIYKAVTCNWEPIGKAEAIYTISALTGVGVITGYININD
jgi:hypothetical protein